jgi:hypothetical protein
MRFVSNRTGSPGLSAVERRIRAVATRVTAHARTLWVVVAATLLDSVLTVYGVHIGLSEANPVAANLIESLGPVAALVTLKSGALAVGGLGWVAMPTDYRGVVPLGLATPWVAATLANAVTVTVALLG